MIKVYLNNFEYKDELQISSIHSPCGLRIEGHSDWGIKGTDIVCSAVSAIVQTSIVAITEVAKLHQEILQENGFLKTEISIRNSEISGRNALNTIIDTMLVGLNLINENYPGTLDIIFE